MVDGANEANTAVDGRPRVYRVAQTTCGRCAYSLAGLPPRGRCPECGRAYDLEVVVLSGRTPDRRSAAVAVATTVGLPVVAAGAFAVFWVGWAVRAGGGVGCGSAIGVATVAVGLVLQVWQGWRVLSPRPVLVRLTVDGCGCEETGRQPVAPRVAAWWRDVGAVSLAPAAAGDAGAAGVCRLTVRRPAGRLRPRSDGRVLFAVDVIVPPADAAALWRRIDAWRVAAAAGAAGVDPARVTPPSPPRPSSGGR